MRPPCILFGEDLRDISARGLHYSARKIRDCTYDTCNSAWNSVEQTYRRTFQPGGQTPRGNRRGGRGEGAANVYMHTTH